MIGEGPYVSVAALCELVLQEKVERLSCVRFMDKLEVTSTLSRPPVSDEEKELIPKVMPVVPFPVHGLVSLKSGGFIGKKMIRIDLITPSGKGIKRTGENVFPAVFEGGEHGVNLILDFTLNTEEEGLYYFDVVLDDEVITRIPLRVTFRQRIPSDLPPPENSTKVESAEPPK